MFPLTPVPPAYRESYLVCLADKICSSYETLHRDRVDWLLYHLQTRTANAKMITGHYAGKWKVL